MPYADHDDDILATHFSLVLLGSSSQSQQGAWVVVHHRVLVCASVATYQFEIDGMAHSLHNLQYHISKKISLAPPIALTPHRVMAASHVVLARGCNCVGLIAPQTSASRKT
eukprot:scaffold76996_cov67-Attheya_sp.AAC.5